MRATVRTFLVFYLLILVFAWLMSSCYGMRRSRGGGQTDVPAQRSINPADVALPEGYRLEVVASGSRSSLPCSAIWRLAPAKCYHRWDAKCSGAT